MYQLLNKPPIFLMVPGIQLLALRVQFITTKMCQSDKDLNYGLSYPILSGDSYINIQVGTSGVSFQVH